MIEKNTYGTTKDDREIDNGMVEFLAAQAEIGFRDVEFTEPRAGRPWLTAA